MEEVTKLVTAYQIVRDSHREQAARLDKAIKSIQDVCEHDYQPTGNNGHNKIFYKCRICLHETYE